MVRDIISGEDVDAMQGRVVRTERYLVPAINHRPPSVYFGVKGITATRILVTSSLEFAVSNVLHKINRNLLCTDTQADDTTIRLIRSQIIEHCLWIILLGNSQPTPPDYSNG